MSADRVHQELTRFLTTRHWPEALLAQWHDILDAARPGALDLLSALGYLAHPQDKPTARQRVAVCALLFALANLIDDLQDEEAQYVRVPGQAPCLQALGWTVFAQELGRLRLPDAVSARLWRLAEKACVGQMQEVQTQRWDAPTYMEVTRRIAGDQWALYLLLLWQDTAWEEEAEQVGRALGTLASVEIDRREGAPRFAALQGEDRDRVLAWRDGLVGEVRAAEALPGVRFMVRWLLQDADVPSA